MVETQLLLAALLGEARPGAAELDGLLAESRKVADQWISELLYAAFLLAARRRFAPAWTRGDVVRYVGSIRAGAPVDDDIDPVTAEALILRALGTDQPLHAGLEAKVAVQTILLGALIADLRLDSGGLEELLVQARSLADRWLSGAVR